MRFELVIASPMARFASVEQSKPWPAELQIAYNAASMSDPSPPPPPLLRWADQAVVASWVAIALVAMIAWWVLQGGHRGQLIEIERAEPRSVEFKLDLNSAEWPELAQLPGVGETLAKRIVESREQQGPFRDRQDLARVRGIGPLTLERLSPYLLPLPDDAALAGR